MKRTFLALNYIGVMVSPHVLLPKHTQLTTVAYCTEYEVSCPQAGGGDPWDVCHSRLFVLPKALQGSLSPLRQSIKTSVTSLSLGGVHFSGQIFVGIK